MAVQRRQGHRYGRILSVRLTAYERGLLNRAVERGVIDNVTAALRYAVRALPAIIAWSAISEDLPRLRKRIGLIYEWLGDPPEEPKPDEVYDDSDAPFVVVPK